MKFDALILHESVPTAMYQISSPVYFLE